MDSSVIDVTVDHLYHTGDYMMKTNIHFETWFSVCSNHGEIHSHGIWDITWHIECRQFPKSVKCARYFREVYKNYIHLYKNCVHLYNSTFFYTRLVVRPINKIYQ